MSSHNFSDIVGEFAPRLMPEMSAKLEIEAQKFWWHSFFALIPMSRRKAILMDGFALHIIEPQIVEIITTEFHLGGK